MKSPKTIDFFRCARPVQDRFVAATTRVAPPAPLLFQSAPRTRAWGFLGASFAITVLAILWLVLGWGNPASRLALHGRSLLAVDAALFFAAAYCFVHGAALVRATEALPYAAGTYVFPACVVDASGPVLQVWPVSEVEGTERLSGPALALRMRGGGRVVVAVERSEDVERAEATLVAARAEVERATAADDVDVLAELDPLQPTRVSSPISSTYAMTRYAPPWMRFDWLLAAAVGAALGVGLGGLRNVTSDSRMFRAVSASDDVSRLEAYLSRGGRHAEEVRDVLLPRAELRRVQSQAGVEALQAFARSHSPSKIQSDIDAAMRSALLGELAKARAIGTVAALDDFVSRHPDHLVDADVAAARHALYARALAAWRAKGGVDPRAAAFVERLLASAEATGRGCEVRFRRRPSKSLDDVDRRIAKRADYGGSDTLPSHHLTDDVMRPREQRVAEWLAATLGADFPPDMLTVRAGPPLAADDALPVGTPIVAVDYTTEWSGVNFLNPKPRAVVAGIRFDFDAHFVAPDAPPLSVAVHSLRAPELWRFKSPHAAASEFEDKVYEQMTDRAFDDLEKRLATLFAHGARER